MSIGAVSIALPASLQPVAARHRCRAARTLGVRAEGIIAWVCRVNCVTHEEMLSRDRTQRVAWARQEAWYQLYATGDYSLLSIGEHFSRHHTTVQEGIGEHVKRIGLQ